MYYVGKAKQNRQLWSNIKNDELILLQNINASYTVIIFSGWTRILHTTIDVRDKISFFLFDNYILQA